MLWNVTFDIRACAVYVFVGVLKAHRLCPRPNNCPIISPPRCARPTTFRYKGGLICPGCDKNICKRPKNHYKK